MKLPNFYWLIVAKSYYKICHMHTGFSDRCLLWYCRGKLMDLFFIRIN